MVSGESRGLNPDGRGGRTGPLVVYSSRTEKLSLAVGGICDQREAGRQEEDS